MAWPATDPAAKRPALPLLGLLDQQFHVRQPMPATEKAHPHGGSRTRQGRVRESAQWIQSLRALGRYPSGVLWVVADRGADIYEHLQQCQTQGLGFMACIIVGVVLTVRYFGQFPRPAVALYLLLIQP